MALTNRYLCQYNLSYQKMGFFTLVLIIIGGFHVLESFNSSLIDRQEQVEPQELQETIEDEPTKIRKQISREDGSRALSDLNAVEREAESPQEDTELKDPSLVEDSAVETDMTASPNLSVSFSLIDQISLTFGEQEEIDIFEDIISTYNDSVGSYNFCNASRTNSCDYNVDNDFEEVKDVPELTIGQVLDTASENPESIRHLEPIKVTSEMIAEAIVSSIDIPNSKFSMKQIEPAAINQKKPSEIQHEIYDDFSETYPSGTTEITLDYKSLFSVPTAIFRKFVDLKMLNLSFNNIDSIPAEIGSLEQLEFLYIRQNRLKSLPDSIGNLKSLKILDLALNRLVVLEPRAFISMQKLQILDLSYNEIVSLPTSIGYLKNLRTLLVFGNNFDEHLDTLVKSLMICYQSMDDEFQHNGIHDQSKLVYESKSLNSNSKQPGRAHLWRLQSILCDQHELEGNMDSRAALQTDFPLLSFLDVTSILDQKNEQRLRVIKEIIQTERIYVEQLQALTEIYRKPLSELNILSENELLILFANISEILNLHLHFILPNMERFDRSNSKPFGKLFSDVEPYLHIYTAYMNNYDIAMRFNDILNCRNAVSNQIQDMFLVVHSKTIEQYQNFANLAVQLGRHTQINLAAFLILPIQRLPRYVLLLKSLSEETGKTHPDYNDTQNALQSITKLVQVLNENKRTSERTRDTLKRLGGVVIPADSALRSVIYPSANRGFVHEYQQFKVVKYVQKGSGPMYLDYVLFCKHKKGQFRMVHRGSIIEVKFKPPSERQARLTQIIDHGADVKFDCIDAIGKSCFLYLCNDVLLVCTTNSILVGFIELLKKTKVSFYPAYFGSSFPSVAEGVIRISNGKCVLYFRSSLDDIMKLNGLLRSLLD